MSRASLKTQVQQVTKQLEEAGIEPTLEFKNLRSQETWHKRNFTAADSYELQQVEEENIRNNESLESLTTDDEFVVVDDTANEDKTVSVSEFLLDSKLYEGYEPDDNYGETTTTHIKSYLTEEEIENPSEAGINWTDNSFEGVTVRGIVYQKGLLVPLVDVLEALRLTSEEIAEDSIALFSGEHKCLEADLDWISLRNVEETLLTEYGVVKVLEAYAHNRGSLVRKFGRWILEVADKAIRRAAKEFADLQKQWYNEKYAKKTAKVKRQKKYILVDNHKRSDVYEEQDLMERRLIEIEKRKIDWEEKNKPAYQLPKDGILRFKDGRPVPLTIKEDGKAYYVRGGIEAEIVDGYIALPRYEDYTLKVRRVDYIRPDRYYDIRMHSEIKTIGKHGKPWRKVVWYYFVSHKSVERQYTQRTWAQKQELIKDITIRTYQTAKSNSLLTEIRNTLMTEGIMERYHAWRVAQAQEEAQKRIEAGEKNVQVRHVTKIGIQEVLQVIDRVFSDYIKQAQEDPFVQNCMFDYNKKGKNKTKDGKQIYQFRPDWRSHKHVYFDLIDLSEQLYPSDIYPQYTRTRYINSVKEVLEFLYSSDEFAFFKRGTEVYITDPDELEQHGFDAAVKQDYRCKAKRENPNKTHVACTFYAELEDSVIEQISSEQKLSPLEIAIEAYQIKPGRNQQACGNRFMQNRSIELHLRCDAVWKRMGKKTGDELRLSAERMIGLMGGETLEQYKARVKHGSISGYIRHYITNPANSNRHYTVFTGQGETIGCNNRNKNFIRLPEVKLEIVVAPQDRIPIRERVKLDEAA